MIAVIDCDPLVHIVAYRQRDTMDEKVVRDNTREFMNSILAKSKCDHYISFVQNVGHTNFRKSIFPLYKAHRKPQEHMKKWKGVIIDELVKSYKTFPLSTIESDDALMLTNIRYESESAEVVIVENDKDLWMIPGKHYNPYKGSDEPYYKISEDKAERYFWGQVVMGDSSDIPNSHCGVHLMGKVKTAKHFENVSREDLPVAALKAYTSKYESVEAATRFSLTLSLVNLIRTPLEYIPETSVILKIEPIKIVDEVEALFEDNFSF